MILRLSGRPVLLMMEGGGEGKREGMAVKSNCTVFLKQQRIE